MVTKHGVNMQRTPGENIAKKSPRKVYCRHHFPREWKLQGLWFLYRRKLVDARLTSKRLHPARHEATHPHCMVLFPDCGAVVFHGFQLCELAFPSVVDTLAPSE